MVDLKSLKNLTQYLTILYVEDSQILLKRMNIFLGNIFKEIYLASDGQEGLSMYDKYKPDIVMTDLTMPNMNGHDMIDELKLINPDVKVIIISAHSDIDNLLKSMHTGVVDFVPKPMDNKLLQNTLYRLSEEILTQKEKEFQYNKPKEIDFSNIDDIVKKLEILKQSHIQVEFINHYKGVPIIDKGSILNIDSNSITVHVPFLQAMVIKYEKETVIDSELFDFAIESKLDKINSVTNSLKLTELHKIESTFKKRKQLAVEPCDNFKVNSKIDTISNDFISLIIDTVDLNFEVGDMLNLELSFDTKEPDESIKEHHIQTFAEVYKIEQKSVKEVNILLLFHLKSPEDSYLQKYISDRRVDIIVEFKHLKV
ncbi:MAG: response regulator [Campylobacterota bacterium]|nr:response regulator [Campylobacterota bacterium]